MDAARPARRPRGDDAGFTLVEVLVSVLVLTVALLALGLVQVKALSGVVLAEERQQATGYSNALIEVARAYTADQVGFDRARAHATATPGTPFRLLPAGATGVVAGTTPGTTFVSKAYLRTTDDVDLIEVSAVTTWTSRNSSAGARTTTTTTLLVSPAAS